MREYKDITGVELQHLITNEYEIQSQMIEIKNIRCLDEFFFNCFKNQVLKFQDCIFEKGLFFYDLSSTSYLGFFGCTLKSGFNIEDFAEDATIEIHRCEILDGFSIPSASNIRLILNRSLVNGNINCSDTSFAFCKVDESQLICTRNIGKLSFQKTTFDKFEFSRSIIESISFENSAFTNTAYFNKVSFTFHSDHLINSFVGIVFEKDVRFSNCFFAKGVNFIDIKFNGLAAFLECESYREGSICTFRNCNFEHNVFFDHSILNNLHFEGITCKGVASFNSFSTNYLSLRKITLMQSADFLYSEIETGTRETFRIIKNEFLKNNNSVESRFYQAKELRAYESEISFRYHPREKIVLWFNKVSNDFGTNWVRGVWFTFTSGLGLYFLYLISLSQSPITFGWNSWKDFLKAVNLGTAYFIKFFLVTHDADFMLQYNPLGISFIIDFAGRIFIGYGIYQTIQAFRKFGK